MIIEMDKLERKHYLKHYLGGPAMILHEDHNQVGQIEEVDLEDGSTLIKSGEGSHWIDGDFVTPSLKKFKDLTLSDVSCLVKNFKWSSIIDFNIDLEDYIVSIDSDAVRIKAKYSDHVIVITKAWSVYAQKANQILTIDNIGTIIFLLCEMGFDVTERF